MTDEMNDLDSAAAEVDLPDPSGTRRARREQARRIRRRRQLARVDAALGVLVALIILVASPGLAVAFLLAILMLLIVVASMVIESLLARRRLALTRSGAGRREEPAHELQGPLAKRESDYP